MSLLNDMKNEIQKSGGSKGKILYIKSGAKARIRFLVDAEDGLEAVFHDSYEYGVNSLCLEEMGKDCPYCERDDLRTRKMYAYPVWDYDAKEVKILLYAANNFTPLPAIIAMYEQYGTLLDRDYVILRTGEKQNTSYTVLPQDKAKFRNAKAKKLTKKEMLKLIAKAFPVNPEDMEDDEKETRKRKKKARKVEPDEDDEDEDETEDYDDDEDEAEDYEEMTPKELFELCRERGLKVEKKKKKSYYIDILEDDDDAEDDEDEDDDEDEWDD